MEMEPPPLLKLLLVFALLLRLTNADDNHDSSMNDSSETSHKSPFKSTAVIIFAAVDVVGLIAVIWLIVVYYKKAKKLKRREEGTKEEKDEKEIERGDDEDEGEAGAGKAKGKLIFVREEGGSGSCFDLDDLLRASAEGLGKGNFGNSYKAVLDEEVVVVVKRFWDLKPLSSEEFGRHLRVIAAHDHPNLLPPLAYYCSRDEKLVVYHYAANGNLFDRLHGDRGHNKRVPFSWNSRLAAAQAVAGAVAHLHENTRSESIAPHGNLKSTNVLYTHTNTIVVSDYGLASIIALPIASQRMVAYRTPEYQTHRRVSKKSDVWSYGALLLELLTGRIPSHTAPEGGVDICSWAHRAVREEWTAEIFDHEICTRRRSSQGMLSLLQIAIRCCEEPPEKRPDMAEVAREVQSVEADRAGEDDDDFSFDPSSFTDDSMSTTPSIVLGDA